MYTVFWQFTVEGTALDVYALPVLIINVLIIAFFFLQSYGATQIPYLWQHSASLSDENEYLISLPGTGVLAVIPILYGALNGRFGSLENLRVLKIPHNRLQSVPASLYNLDLTELDIRGDCSST